MRAHFGRRQTFVVVTLVTSFAVGAMSLGPVVRARVAREAAGRQLDVEIGHVRPGWFAVRLLDVRLHPRGISSMQAHANEMRIALGALAQIGRIDLIGGEVVLTGSPESLRDDWRKWRAGRAGDNPPNHHTTAVDASGVSVRWNAPETSGLGAELRGLSVSRLDGGTRLAVTDGQLRLGNARIDLGEASAQAGADGILAGAHASSLTVGWSGGDNSRRPVLDPNALGTASSPPWALTGRTPRAGRRSSPAPFDAGTPLVPLPDLHAIRAGAAALAGLLAEHMQLDADVVVDALTWSITPPSDAVALTFGPGPLSLSRAKSHMDLAYSTEPHETSPPLSLRVLLPTDGGDLVITVAGGPVSVSLLGVQEGAAGLTDVDRATIVGKARVVLAGDGSGVTFDEDGAVHGLSVYQPRLALAAVHGLDVGLRATGALTSGGEVRLDDFAATLGALRVVGSGVLDQQLDHVAASGHVEIPLAACQSLLDSIPTALLPVLQGTKMGGSFAARARLAFDTRSLDDLELTYDAEDRCRVVQVPPTLDHDRFTRPFAHRIYLPDGSTTEEITGPGTASWTPLDEISPYMQTAVLTTEDGAFPKHHGYNHGAIRASLIANLKARRFVRGASTITMQLAKNLFLSRDKTLSRKLEEVVLTDYMEQTFSKDELMELYLNVIEFGPAVYGITSAAEYYFARTPAELDLAECLFLASLLPAPLRYSGMRNGEQPPDGWMRAIHSLMEAQRKRGLITDAELSEGENEQILFWHAGPRPPPRAAVRARARAGAGDDDSEIPDPFESPPE